VTRWHPHAALRRIVLATLVPLLAGCVVHHHRVGNGPAGTGEQTTRQYYILFGWLRLNDVDTQRFAADLSSYSIETSFSFTDLLLTPLLLPFTVTSRTITIHK
jgi:hypothetical protein